MPEIEQGSDQISNNHPINTHDSLLEIVVHRGSLTVFEQLRSVLSSDHPASLIYYIRGLERLTLAEQRQLVSDLQKLKSHLLISFMKDLS